LAAGADTHEGDGATDVVQCVVFTMTADMNVRISGHSDITSSKGIKKLLYRAQVKATASRDTRTVSSDGVLDLALTRLAAATVEWGGRCLGPWQLLAPGHGTSGGLDRR
jgi:hypothetical protein